MAIVTTDNQHYTDIAAAIRSKNGTETQYKPSEMAAAIQAISGGSGSVLWPDFTTEDDGATRLCVGFFGRTDREITLGFSTDGSVVKIDWGDGIVEEITSDNPSHTYGTEKDDYVIVIYGNTAYMNSSWCVDSDCDYDSNNLCYLNNKYNTLLYKFCIGSDCYGPFTASRNANLIEAYYYINDQAYQLLRIGMNNDADFGFQHCLNIERVWYSGNGIFGKNCWTNSRLMFGSDGLDFYVPESVVYIADNGLPICNIHMLSETPPSVESELFWEGENMGYKIYVPASAVETYKSKTNWSAKANFIYPESEE